MKKFLIFIIKIAIVLSIFVYLFLRAGQEDSFERLMSQPKNWGMITFGCLFGFLATIITMVRWCWLVRALGVSLPMNEAIRLGFIGYVFNLSPMGIVGGDLVKGVLLAKKSPNAKAACAVSVIADRVIGLYVMFLIGLIAVWASGFYRQTQSEAVFGTKAMIWLTVISTAGIIFLLWPESVRSRRSRLIRRLPLVGPLSERLFTAAALYRHRVGVLTVSTLATFAVHFLFALCLWFLAMGLFGFAPSPTDHLVIYPIANCGTMIPLSAGPMEYFLDVLYPLFDIPNHAPCGHGFGMMVGIAYRLMTIIIAAVGGFYYLASRSEISAALDEIKEEQAEKNKEKSVQPLERLQ